MIIAILREENSKAKVRFTISTCHPDVFQQHNNLGKTKQYCRMGWLYPWEEATGVLESAPVPPPQSKQKTYFIYFCLNVFQQLKPIITQLGTT